MISLLATPSVCVIDDEREEYEVILGALNRLRVPAHHIKGTDVDELPDEPFRSVRLVFQDLHLGGEMGKNAASRAANFFTKTVHYESAPVVVVIWSKHTDESVATDGEPEDDQPTVSDLFKEAVLASSDAYKSRLIFIEMKKPQPGDRPDNEAWINELVAEINSKLSGAPAASLLWEWEQTVKAAAAKVIDQLVSFSTPCPNDATLKDDDIRALLSCLAAAHSEGDLDVQTAPRHIASALSQLLSDQLEHNTLSCRFLAHGEWLVNKETLDPPVAACLNGLLITSESNTDGTAFAPGNVYRIKNEEFFTGLFDQTFGALKHDGFNPLQPKSEEEKEEKRKSNAASKKKWKESAEPVFVEVSPVCDVAQGKRTTATLVAGLVVPATLEPYVKRQGAFHALPIFTLRQAGEILADNTEVILVISSKYRTTLPCKTEHESLARWFRIRELPTASIRTWLASQIGRIGFVSL